MKRVIWIADVYAAQSAGGAELVNEVMIGGLESLGWTVERTYSSQITPEYIRENLDSKFVVGHFLQLNRPSFQTLIDEADYILYEHDHKYVVTRDPSVFPDYLAPWRAIVNSMLYRNAKAVLCQSNLHAQVVRKNLMLSNIVDMNCSLWSEHELSVLKENCDVEKNNKAFVLNSNNPIKGTAAAVAWCQANKVDYDLHGPLEHEELMKTMAKYEKVVFFPQTLESFNRFVVEARALNCQLVTNEKNGATHQEWFGTLKGDALIQYIEATTAMAPLQLSMLLDTGECDWFIEPVEIPKISLVTSMFKGEAHIRPFLENMVRQSIFSHCELIIIDANSPQNEEPVIREFMEKYDNIIYKKLDYDPGIYGVWNMGIEMATGEIISNANLDDRRSRFHLEAHVRELVQNPEIDLVYSESYVTEKDFEDFENNTSGGKVYPISDFSSGTMIKCLPGCMPVWRKSMHNSIGLFESDYKYAGDWEMWLRAVRNGSKFTRIPGVLGMYFMNPDGLSTSPANEKERFAEEKEIFWEYTDVFGENVTNNYASYFSGER
jgi:glycosyltransferase involved in cell wall biosynthesis